MFVRFDVCASVKIFNLFSHNRQRILYNYTQCSTVDSRHTHIHVDTFSQCGIRCMCMLVRSVNGSSIMNTNVQCICALHITYLCLLQIGMQILCVRTCTSVCVFVVWVYFIFLQLLDNMPNAVLPPFKIQNSTHFFGIKRNRNIITVIINKRVGIQHTLGRLQAQYSTRQRFLAWFYIRIFFLCIQIFDIF